AVSAGSPPVEFSSERSKSTPPRTLSCADADARGVPAVRVRWIQFHVPGRICITPRASELETKSLLKPLSCQPIASAREGETPLSLAIEPTSDALTCSGVGYGGSLTEPAAALPTGCEPAEL